MKYVVYLSVIHEIECEDEYAAGEVAEKMASRIDTHLNDEFESSGSTEITKIVVEDEEEESEP